MFIRQDHVIALNLNNDLTIGGHVGNAVDQYERLTFMMFMVDEINTQFEDDLGNQISVQGSVKDQVVEFTVTSHTTEDIYWMVREIDQVESVLVNGVERVRADKDNAESLDTSCYNVRERDLILSFTPGENHVQIKLNAGGNEYVN
ncbi:hypothetical protein D3C81_1826470 [compost metagenome]